jgi:hypothetical protein
MHPFWSDFSIFEKPGDIFHSAKKILEGSVMIRQAVPESGDWTYRCDSPYEVPPDVSPLMFLLLDIYEGDEGGKSPLHIQVDPTTVKVKSLTGSEFVEFLLGRPPEGATSFLWDCYGDFQSSFFTSKENPIRHRISFVHESLYWHEGFDDEGYSTGEAEAWGELWPDELIVYPFPADWHQLATTARLALQHMGKQEKALINLESSLANFVKLLGSDMVRQALDKISPKST